MGLFSSGKKKRKAEHRQKRVTKYNKKVQKREEESFKRGMKLSKLYGDEKFFRKKAFTKEQFDVLNKFAKYAQRTPTAMQDLLKAPKLRGLQTPPELQDLLKDPRLRQFEEGQRLEEQQGYKKGLDSILDQIQGGGQRYRDYEDPLIKEFQQELLPKLGARFDVGSQKGGGAWQNAVAGAAGNLQSKLGRMRADLEREARQEIVPYLQAPINNQQTRNQQLLGQNQQRLDQLFGTNAQTLQANQQGVNRAFGMNQQNLAQNQQRLNQYLGTNQQILGMNQLGQRENAMNYQYGTAALGARPYNDIYRPAAFGQAFNSGSYQQYQPAMKSAGEEFLQAMAPGIGQGLGQAAGAAMI